ncbi:hypothetical protein CYMTET_53942 [Cymbomonas tetramitiformis]|uniref:RanBP-type and C3HC4-type zinc finger-containing protein 1 n=1 Tax=Cymbomonas tetramitiformis TaxID=36881 RepID=A0AAE0BHQ8_9CHLO|nr:hypothetical protein CYMTET_53942 [Cymbomonas tetramitiformis]
MENQSVDDAVVISSSDEEEDGVEEIVCNGSAVSSSGRRQPNEEGVDRWPCLACTYLNYKEALQCTVCETRRGGYETTKNAEVRLPSEAESSKQGQRFAASRYSSANCESQRCEACCKDHLLSATYTLDECGHHFCLNCVQQDTASRLQVLQSTSGPRHTVPSILSHFQCPLSRCRRVLSCNDLQRCLGPLQAFEVHKKIVRILDSHETESRCGVSRAQGPNPGVEDGADEVLDLTEDQHGVVQDFHKKRHTQMVTGEQAAQLPPQCNRHVLRALSVHHAVRGMTSPRSATGTLDGGASVVGTKRKWAQPVRRGKGGRGGGSGWAAGTGYGGDHGHGHQEDVQRRHASMVEAQVRKDAEDEAQRRNIHLLTSELEGISKEGAATSVTSAVFASLRCAGGVWGVLQLLESGSLMDICQRAALCQAVLRLLRRWATFPLLLPLLCLPSQVVPPQPLSTPPPSSSGRSHRPERHPVEGTRRSSRLGGKGEGSAGAAGVAEEDVAPEQGAVVMDTLRSLAQQARLMARSGEQLAEGDDEESISALSLALDLQDTLSILEEGIRALQGNFGPSWIERWRIPAAASSKGEEEATGSGAPSPRCQQTEEGAYRGGGDGAVNGAGDGRAVATKAEERDKYEKQVKELVFDEAEGLLTSHYFANEAAGRGMLGGGEWVRQRMRRVLQEVASLHTALPVSWDASIVVRMDASRPDVLRALFLPPRSTPYGNGAFFFDVLLPADYPNCPPRVQFLTTGGGRVRFNPNLYHDGKVCLSLLGTWAGPGWDRAHSTLLQVLVSIQSLILVEEPYFNEPGYERSRGTRSADKASQKYDAQVRANTLLHALLPALRRPPHHFAEVLRRHYTTKAQEIREQCDSWAAEAAAESAGGSGPHPRDPTAAMTLPPGHMEPANMPPLSHTVASIKAELDKLSPQVPIVLTAE